MSDHRYYLNAKWTEGRKGIAEAEGVANRIPFSAPPEFQGEAGTWTPEHFFAAALGSCFITTFKAIAEYSKFEYQALEVEVEGILEKEQGGFSFTKVVLQPILQIAAEADRERALRLLEKSERACLISRSVKSQIELQPEIKVGTTESFGAIPAASV
jgi:peroxiredoxin-like protein